MGDRRPPGEDGSIPAQHARAADAGRADRPGWSQVVRSPGRVLTALIAWPPLGLGAALLYGELTGCARFSVACADATTPWPWVIQLVTIALLLLMSAVARIAVFGTYAMVIVVTPLTLFLVTGGREGSDLATRLLVGGLAAAWVAGVVIGVVRRRPGGSEPFADGAGRGPRAEGAPPVP